MRFLSGLILSGMSLAGSAQAMPLPDCAGEVAAAKAHVTRVGQDGALILANGRAAILEGIRLPGADRPATLVAQQALQVLKQLAVETSLVLTSTPPRQDRYGRIRVSGCKWRCWSAVWRGSRSRPTARNARRICMKPKPGGGLHRQVYGRCRNMR